MLRSNYISNYLKRNSLISINNSYHFIKYFSNNTYENSLFSNSPATNDELIKWSKDLQIYRKSSSLSKEESEIHIKGDSILKYMCNRLLSFSNKPLKKEDEIKEYKEELSRNIYLISKSLNPKRVSYLFRILHSPLNNNIFPPFPLRLCLGSFESPELAFEWSQFLLSLPDATINNNIEKTLIKLAYEEDYKLHFFYLLELIKEKNIDVSNQFLSELCKYINSFKWLDSFLYSEILSRLVQIEKKEKEGFNNAQLVSILPYIANKNNPNLFKKLFDSSFSNKVSIYHLPKFLSLLEFDSEESISLYKDLLTYYNIENSSFQFPINSTENILLNSILRFSSSLSSSSSSEVDSSELISYLKKALKGHISKKNEVTTVASSSFNLLTSFLISVIKYNIFYEKYDQAIEVGAFIFELLKTEEEYFYFFTNFFFNVTKHFSILPVNQQKIFLKIFLTKFLSLDSSNRNDKKMIKVIQGKSSISNHVIQSLYTLDDQENLSKFLTKTFQLGINLEWKAKSIILSHYYKYLDYDKIIFAFNYIEENNEENRHNSLLNPHYSFLFISLIKTKSFAEFKEYVDELLESNKIIYPSLFSLSFDNFLITNDPTRALQLFQYLSSNFINKFSHIKSFDSSQFYRELSHPNIISQLMSLLIKNQMTTEAFEVFKNLLEMPIKNYNMMIYLNQLISSYLNPDEIIFLPKILNEIDLIFQSNSKNHSNLPHKLSQRTFFFSFNNVLNLHNQVLQEIKEKGNEVKDIENLIQYKIKLEKVLEELYSNFYKNFFNHPQLNKIYFEEDIGRELSNEEENLFNQISEKYKN